MVSFIKMGQFIRTGHFYYVMQRGSEWSQLAFAEEVKGEGRIAGGAGDYEGHDGDGFLLDEGAQGFQHYGLEAGGGIREFSASMEHAFEVHRFGDEIVGA